MIQVSVSAPPRGGAEQANKTFTAQTVRGSFAWGSSPATATLDYPGDAPVTVGALVNFRVGAHYFAGICKSDVSVNGSDGYLRSLEFNDLRHFLTWDWVFGAFNLPDVRLVDGVRIKRYKHIYPGDYATYTWTFTNAPLPAWKILDAVLRAPTVFTPWSVNLTSNGMFPGGLLSAPIYGVDCLSGMRLDALLNLICDKTGLVFCHDPLSGPLLGANASNAGQVGPGRLGDYRLVFTRKGYGVLPLPFPAESDERRLGSALTENAQNVCILGDRNLYQVLEVPMIKDWAPAWEQFMEVDMLAQDLYDHEVNPLNGVAYNNYSAGNAGGDDPDHWIGAGDAKARALEITVAEYVALRNARPAADGAQFADTRKFGGRWRMDMPAALYIETLVFRAFRPDIDGVDNIHGNLVPLTSAEIADQLLARTYYDPLAGSMTVDNPPQPVDGNGVLIAKGYQVGEDLFRLVQPDRMNADFFSAANRVWAQVGFQIDDSGEGVRFIIADAPVFVSDNLLTTVGNYVVLNAGATLAVPEVKAALVFRCEPYVYWQGTGLITSGPRDPALPLPGRSRVEPVGDLNQEFIVDASGDFTEIPYADNLYANDKAQLFAQSLLLNQPSYLAGGYKLVWNPAKALAAFGTPLAPGTTSCFDRLDIEVGPDGVMEVVDFTAERQRDRFEPERELDRRSLQNSLFPGQQELRQQAQDQERFNAVLRKTPADLFDLFRKLLRGEVDGNLFPTKFASGATLPATLPVGTPILRAPANTVATAPGSVSPTTDTVFVGVVKRHNESTAGQFYVQTTGDTLALVQGPVNENDPLGASTAGGTDFSTNGAYLVKSGTPPVGLALEAITGSGIQLIKVRLGAGSGGVSDSGLAVWI
jgi:hypothetical protein